MANSEAGSKKILAGILGIVLGFFGAQRFALGDVTGGVIRIIISVLTCGAGSIIGLIEGIIYLTKSDEEFDEIYIKGGKKWF